MPLYTTLSPCHLTFEKGVINAFDDVASNHQSLPQTGGAPPRTAAWAAGSQTPGACLLPGCLRSVAAQVEIIANFKSGSSRVSFSHWDQARSTRGQPGVKLHPSAGNQGSIWGRTGVSLHRPTVGVEACQRQSRARERCRAPSLRCTRGGCPDAGGRDAVW
jgi:hypothetical protein